MSKVSFFGAQILQRRAHRYKRVRSLDNYLDMSFCYSHIGSSPILANSQCNHRIVSLIAFLSSRHCHGYYHVLNIWRFSSVICGIRSHQSICYPTNMQVQSQESAGMLHHLSGGAWDPHDVNVVASTSESSIQFWDLRTMKYDPILVPKYFAPFNYAVGSSLHWLRCLRRIS